MYLDIDFIAIMRNKIPFHDFCLKYFNTYHLNSHYFSNINCEELNLRIASDFYEDYVNSNDDIENYIRNTTKQV